MATRRRIGVSAATTEAARRQLMQPVPCWEKVWSLPENSPPGSTLRVFKWIKVDKMQQFSDDEGEDEPLAPLPDEPEVVDGDEEMDQDEALPETVAEAAPLTDITDLTATQDDLQSKPPSPKPLLSISSELIEEQSGDGLDASLKPLDGVMDVGINLGEKETLGDSIELDMAGLGPDGLGLENSHDLSQMEGADALIGGHVMDESTDPFAETVDLM